MAAYALVNVEITDPAGFAKYRKLVPATIAAFGGRFLARGGATEVLEGGWIPNRLVVLEFPDVTTLNRPGTTRPSISDSSSYASELPPRISLLLTARKVDSLNVGADGKLSAQFRRSISAVGRSGPNAERCGHRRASSAPPPSGNSMVAGAGFFDNRYRLPVDRATALRAQNGASSAPAGDRSR